MAQTVDRRLHRQAKVLSSGQIRALLKHIDETRHPVRNRTIILLSLRAGLRAKEIAALEWRKITDAESQIAAAIRLTDSAAKGRSGVTSVRILRVFRRYSMSVAAGGAALDRKAL